MAEVHLPSQPDLLRAALRAGLAAHRQRSASGRILESQRAEREAQRAARADLADALAARSVVESAAGRTLKRPDADALTIARRDAYMRALAYPLSGAELASACGEAVRAAGIREADRSDTAAALALYVVARHGKEPLRCDVSREWLKLHALRVWQRQAERDARADGRKEAAKLDAEWAERDALTDDADADADWTPDSVYRTAAARSAPVEVEALDTAELVERLSLTEKQAAALTLALESEQRVTAAMSGAERAAADSARAALRRRYPDADALRYALRPHGYRSAAASAAVDAALAVQRQRSALAGSGSHLPGSGAPLGGGALYCERVSVSGPPEPFSRSIGPRGPVPAERRLRTVERRPCVSQRPIWARPAAAPVARPARESAEHRSAARALTLALRFHVGQLSGAPLPARVSFTASGPLPARQPRPITRRNAAAALAALRG